MVSAKKLLVVYCGVYGHTRKICEAMRPVLAAQGAEVTLAALPDQAPEPDDFDAVLIGASIRNGKHNPAVLEFIEKHRAQLEDRMSGFFSVNLVARKPHKNTAETNPYVQAFLKSSPWQPDQVGVFGGRLNYRRYRRFDRWAIRFIMWMNKGPTELDTDVEFTDWAAVERFAEEFARRVEGKAE